MSALSFMRWAENYHLFILGGVVCFCVFRTRCRPAAQRQWPRLHLTSMGVTS